MHTVEACMSFETFMRLRVKFAGKYFYLIISDSTTFVDTFYDAPLSGRHRYCGGTNSCLLVSESVFMYKMCFICSICAIYAQLSYKSTSELTLYEKSSARVETL